MKTRKKVSEKLFSDVWIRLMELHFLFMEQSGNNVFGQTDKWYFYHIEAYLNKWNILKWKLERSFLRNFFVMCEFTSQNNNFLFMKKISNTVFL